tara:strand:- start:14496 stop:14765 length:270 start_codon:yes stop_codon:yes gene_type:complete
MLQKQYVQAQQLTQAQQSNHVVTQMQQLELGCCIYSNTIGAMLQNQQLFRCFVLLLRHCFGFVSLVSSHDAIAAMSVDSGLSSTACTSL